MSSPDFLGLGELLWDCFPDRRLPGGAPANVAFHAQQLGLAAATVTRVGRDSLGEEICEFLRAQGLSIDLVQRDPVHGTGTVTVTPSATGAGYVFKPDSAWDFLEAQPELIAAMRSARAVCFGTLAQRSPISRETIHSCLTAASPDCVIVYDVNLRPPFFEREWIERSFRRARIIKLNDDEVRILSEMFATGSDDDVDYARQLLATYSQIELVCVTRGSNGCLAVSRSEVVDVPGIPVRVVDTVGAGDAFTAALIHSKLAGWPLRPSAEFANRVGALVASRPGAMPVLREEVAALWRESARHFSGRQTGDASGTR
jgi:fructokinase